MPKYTQEEFDSELLKMIQEAANEGKLSCRIVARDLHDRVVLEPQENRTPMACSAMKKLPGKIIYSPPSGQGKTLEIEYDIVLLKKIKR